MNAENEERARVRNLKSAEAERKKAEEEAKERAAKKARN
jgi:hypothetical protein